MSTPGEPPLTDDQILDGFVDYIHKHPVESLKPSAVTQAATIIFEQLVSNAVNFSRYAYALKKLAQDNKQVYGSKYDIDESRRDPLGTNTNTPLFNNTLNFFKRNLIDNFEVLKYYEVNGIGGTSYVAKFDALHDPTNKDVNFEKWIIVAFRGTHGDSEWWKTNFKLSHVHYEPFNSGKYVKGHKNWYKHLSIHGGFYKALSALTPQYEKYDNLYEQFTDLFTKDDVPSDQFGPKGSYDIFKDVAKIREENPGYKLVVTGHSLGGALASLFGFEAQALGWNPTIISIAAPQVGFHRGQPKFGIVDEQAFTFENLYLKKILKLFNITDEQSRAKKFKAIETGDTTTIFSPDEAFFINVISVGDVVPLVPPYRYQKHGGFPLHIKTSSFPTIEALLKPIQLLEIDKDYKNRVKRALEEEDDGDLIDILIEKIFGSDGDEDPTKQTEESYANTPDEAFDGIQSDLLDVIKGFSSDRGLSIGRVLWVAFNNSLDSNLLYRNHVFYGLYYISDEYNSGDSDFPTIPAVAVADAVNKVIGSTITDGGKENVKPLA